MSEIVPRWEWRTFDRQFGRAETTLAALSPVQVVESSELYVVSAAGEGVVKVRDELMDVKQLHEVDADGLERWSPVLKAPFPLSSTDLATVVQALGVELTSPPARTTYSWAELLVEVVDPQPDLLAVEVHKTRRRFKLGGCQAELTDVRTDHGSTRTLAVESESAESVMAAVAELGLVTRPNVNYSRALRVLARFGVERCAVVDVGTNSVKFHIGERNADGVWRRVVDRAEVTRLGDGLEESGRLNPEPMARTVEAIAGMASEAKAQRVAAIAAVGTAGLRIAPNRQDFVDAVEARCAVHVDVISGEDEARLAYLAAVAGLGLKGRGSRVVFDTGGGSSQFSFGDGDRVTERFSVEVGAVRFTEQYALDGEVSPDVLAGALGAIEQDLGRLRGHGTPETLVGMGGAVTNLAAVRHALPAYDPDVVQGTVLDAAEIERQIELYRTHTADQRREVVGLQPARAEVILAGALIVRTVLRVLGKDSLTVSDRGLRYGVLSERFG
ncbi:MAG: Ppx/GppA family phosphatase [Nocardioides sp.]|nr:Ppx/GppA family phosphatase [Nocardioides sp.]